MLLLTIVALNGIAPLRSPNVSSAAFRPNANARAPPLAAKALPGDEDDQPQSSTAGPEYSIPTTRSADHATKQAESGHLGEEAEPPPHALPRRWGLRAVLRSVGRRAQALRPLITRIVGICGVSDEDVKNTLGSTLTGLLWGALALSALGTLGVDIKPLLGLSTLLGFAFSISVKSILSNFFSAAYVLWVRPFKRGDTITVMEFGKSDKYTGKVLQVDYHFVKLLSSDGKVVMIPSHGIYGKVVQIESA